MVKTLAYKREETMKADKAALRHLQSGLYHLNEALAAVRHYTALSQIGDAVKAARHAENLLTDSIE